MANILIVDDDEVVQKTLRADLLKGGHTVFVAKDGYLALELIEKETLHLIITDINMPMGLNGFKVVNSLRNNPKTKDIPVIIISSRRSEVDVLKGIDVGVDDYVIKPIDFDIFSAKVATLLNRAGHTFSISRVKQVGFVQTQLQMNIVGISEEGLQFMSDIGFEVRSKVDLESPIYDEIGINTPVLRIAHCEKLDKDPQTFIIKANFIGLSSGDLQKVRVYINAARFKKF